MHENSLANLDPRANYKGGRVPYRLSLSDGAVKGAELYAEKLELLRKGNPNRSESATLILEAVHWIMTYGGTMTIDGETGQISLKK